MTTLRAVAEHMGLPLALPTIVLEEELAKYGHEVAQAHGAVRKAVKDLGMLVPDWPADLSPFDTERAARAR
ncbi:hypothetical protein OG948_57865 (plasmid) [Embleya sp. NBC_00888]|uniref:hypothetical protein n=1 Tax=Embleya sp. NBC_00888 TaxID=2975960 RepID=UPI002F90B524|nr:hypothetical protein OG948_57865 [Embleya sp. NBC_00888]